MIYSNKTTFYNMKNGKDTSGNAFKFSLIPLTLGVLLIFFLYKGCGSDIVHTNQPKPLSSEFTLTAEEKAAKEKEEAEAKAAEEAAVTTENTQVGDPATTTEETPTAE